MDFQKTSLFYSRRYVAWVAKDRSSVQLTAVQLEAWSEAPDYLTISDSQTISLSARATAGSQEVLVYLMTCSTGRSIRRSQLFCFSHVLAMLCTFSGYSSKWPLSQKNKGSTTSALSPSRKAFTPGRLRSNCSGIVGSGLVLGLILRPPRGSLTTCSNQRPPGQGAPSGVVVMEPLFSAGVVLCFIGQTTLGLTNFEISVSLFHLLWNQEGSPNLVGGRSYWSFKLFSAISNKHSFLPPQDWHFALSRYFQHILFLT